MKTTARCLIDAFLAGDAGSAASLLSPEARFHSPIRDYDGSERIGAVWQAVANVVQNTRQTSIHERDCETVAFFVGTIQDIPVDGVLRTITDESDHVLDVTLMVRPWAALKAGLADIAVV